MQKSKPTVNKCAKFRQTYTHETKQLTGVQGDSLGVVISEAIEGGWTVELVCPVEISEDGVIRNIPDGASIRGKCLTFYKVKLYRCD